MGEDHHGKTCRVSGNLFERDASLYMTEPCSAVLLRNEYAHDAHLAQFRNDVHRNVIFFIPLRRKRRDFFLRKLRKGFTKHFLFSRVIKIH